MQIYLCAVSFVSSVLVYGAGQCWNLLAPAAHPPRPTRSSDSQAGTAGAVLPKVLLLGRGVEERVKVRL